MLHKFTWFLYTSSLSSVMSGAWIAAVNIVAYQDTHSLSILGILWIVRILSRMLLQPFAGALVDRWKTRMGLMWAYLMTGLCAAIGSVLLDQNMPIVPTILSLIFAFQVFDLFTGPGSGKFIQAAISNNHLARFNALRLTYGSTAAIIGPSIGALVVVYEGISPILMAFAVVQFLISFGIARSKNAWSAEGNGGISFVRTITQGWAYAATRKDIISLLIISGTASGGWRMVEVLVPLLSSHTRSGIIFTGPAYSLLAVGSIFIGILLTRYPKKYPFRWIYWSQLIGIVPFLLFLWFPSGWGLVIAMIVTGANADFHSVVVATHLQSSVPSSFYGRTSGLYRTILAVGALPITVLTAMSILKNVWVVSFASMIFIVLGLVTAVFIFPIRHADLQNFKT